MCLTGRASDGGEKGAGMLMQPNTVPNSRFSGEQRTLPRTSIPKVVDVCQWITGKPQRDVAV